MEGQERWFLEEKQPTITEVTTFGSGEGATISAGPIKARPDKGLYASE
jgi:hypothetical protein